MDCARARGFRRTCDLNLPLGFHEADQCTPFAEGLSHRGGTAARRYIAGTQLETEARAMKNHYSAYLLQLLHERI